MTKSSLNTVKKRRKFRYPVIRNVYGKTASNIREDLEHILDCWPLFESGEKGPFLNYLVTSACFSQMYRCKSSELSLGFLFLIWKQGKLVHPSFCDCEGNIINEKFYQVGISQSTTYCIVYGIVPSLKTVIIGKPPVYPDIADIEANIDIYSEESLNEMIVKEYGEIHEIKVGKNTLITSSLPGNDLQR